MEATGEPRLRQRPCTPPEARHHRCGANVLPIGRKHGRQKFYFKDNRVLNGEKLALSKPVEKSDRR